MNANKMIIKGTKRPKWKWIFMIIGELFTLAGIYFLFAALVNFLAASAREPYSPVILFLISAFFLLVGIPMIVFGIKR